MRKLAESVLSFSWAVSLYGTRQAAATLGAALGRLPEDRVAVSFDTVTWSAGRELEGLLLEAFQAGDALQRDAVDLAAGFWPEDVYSPASWFEAGAEAAGSTSETARFVLPGTAGLAWRGAANKLEVYRLVKQVRGKLGVPPAGPAPFPLAALVDRAYALGSYPALWAIEGLGHDYVDHVWTAERPPAGLLNGLLSDRAVAGLPAGSLLMLHAGIGLGFAQRLLDALPPAAPAAEVERTVARFVRLCRDNSLPSHLGAALESLGLVTRTFHPARLAAVARALGAAAPEVAGFFWHGVGRALYFLPVNFLPVGETTWRPFAMGMEEAPDPAALANVQAGLGWAFTLVNMRQPAICERLLLGAHGDELAAAEGFTDGVASAAAMRADTTPDDPVLAAFLEHRPAAGQAARWDRLVNAPARAALAELPRWRSEGRLGEIFRYQPSAGTGWAA